jgi:YhcN/YlaJ family sporulation lipoprotein
MMKNMNNIVKSLGFIVLSTLLVTACNAADQDQTQPFDQTASFDQANPHTQIYPDEQYQTDNRILYTQDYAGIREENGNQNQEAQEAADRLVKLATGVEEVNDATAVVIGRWAIVGVDVNAQLDRSKVGSIKYSVAEALKDDPKGAYAIVTADLDTNYRLRQMAKEIREGKPVAGVMDELAAIVGRLMPQIPRNVQDPDSPQERDKQGAGSKPPANP